MNSLSIRTKNELSKKKRKGFTLIELIIVIAIIAILAAIALPKFGQIRQNGNIKADIATAKNIQTAILTGIANGDIVLDSNGDASVTVSTVLDGNVPKVKANGHTNGTFTASVDKNIVTVKADNITIFPAPSSPYNIS